MDRAVLADLERREVEPVRRDLPAQLRDLAPGDALQAILDERGLELGQLRVEVRGRVVVAGARVPYRRPAPRGSGAAARR